MSQVDYIARAGTHAQVGRFRSLPGVGLLSRFDVVLCRTERGIERVEILESIAAASETEVDGRLLCKFTQEDHLLWRNLRDSATHAMQACQVWLETNQHDEVLLDVEPLMDGRTLFFHFLGAISDDVQSHVDQLAIIYEQTVQASPFAKLLNEGCGPGCGTESAKNGCGTSGGCAVCVVASACKK